MFDQEAEQKIRSRVLHGEKILWCGKPAQGLVTDKSDALMIPFSILWGFGAIIWEVIAVYGYIKSGFNSSFLVAVIFGIPIFLFGLYLIAGRFIYDIKAKKHTCYGITEKKVIIMTGKKRINVTEIPIERIIDVKLQEKKDGSGTIYLIQSDIPTGAGFTPTGLGVYSASFRGIKGARDIYNILKMRNEPQAETKEEIKEESTSVDRHDGSCCAPITEEKAANN